MKSKLNAHNCPPVLMVSSCPKDATTIQKSLCNVSDLQDQQIQQNRTYLLKHSLPKMSQRKRRRLNTMEFKTRI